jgi:O-antigen/teichoic acid export membrane protein
VLIIYYSITFFSPLIAWKYERKVIIGNFVGLIVNLILNLVLVPILFERGSAIAAIITEISVFIVFAIIFFPIFKTLLFGQYLRFFLISAASTLPFLLINIEFLNSLPFMIISFIIFLALIFLTKTITLQEIKFIKKDEV